ncbi:hypothetical protein WISP_51875 [Willisornis vidua]|uniref:Uncharacterized protein n=1 Tax=Willisornis vidua TaxID=1566151 RepID=A0ABQ9DE53_9PASS|nr:hypothetical protein WISP_51875 [Willisornis vidua]
MGPKLNIGFKMWPHQCQVQRGNHFPSPAGHTIPDSSEDATGLLGHLGTLLAHVQPAADQCPQVPFHQTALKPFLLQPVVLLGTVVIQVQAHFTLLNLTTGLSPSVESAQIPLQSLPALQLGVVCKLTEDALNPLIQIINKDVKQDHP